MDSDNDNDFLDNVDSGNVSSGDDGDDDFAMEVDMPSSTERQLDTDDHQYKVLTTDEIVQYQREIIDEVNRVLKVSHAYFLLCLFANIIADIRYRKNPAQLITGLYSMLCVYV